MSATPAASTSPSAAAEAQLKQLEDTVKSLTATVEQINKQDRSQTPFARRGENILGSRGFQFSKLVGLANKKMAPEDCKIELEYCQRLKSEMTNRCGYQPHEQGSILVPLSSDLMLGASPELKSLADEASQLVPAGAAGADLQEMRQIARSVPGVRRKALSWQDESGLGVFVGPPVIGEPIELLRNQEVFMKAGARLLPFPPSGRMSWPRMTGASTANWVGEAQQIATSQPTSGDVVLQAKKLAILVTVPNELFRFPSVSVEQIVREDMMRVASLKMDKTFLEDPGSATTPKGIINYANILKYTAGSPGTNGDTLVPEDILKIIGTVEEKNVTFNAWTMRPLLYAALGNKRADAVTAGDKAGMFLFNVLRTLQGGNVDVTNYSTGSLESYPVHKSNQISAARTKGSGTTLTYVLGGDFTQYLIAMSGVMEFMVNQMGDSLFQYDQSQIRLICWADGAPRHEEAFVLVDNLLEA